ncbi:MAG: ABC transporter permease [Rhizobiaceae bacterium]
MTALLGGLLANPTILAIIAGVLGALGWGFHQRLAGAKAERTKQAADQLDAIQKRKETDDEVASLGPADVDARLRGWLRDK